MGSARLKDEALPRLFVGGDSDVVIGIVDKRECISGKGRIATENDGERDKC